MTSPTQETYSSILKQQLSQWGLTDLYGDVDKLIKEGLGEDAINVQLQQTKAWKRRFAANEDRVNHGLAVLSPAEYMATESAYRQVMQSYGLPSGFWDSNDDFTSLIGRDVSPDEVNQRVKVARDAFLSSDDGTRQMWRDLYGLTDGAGIAAILDPDRALPIVNRMAATAKVGSSVARDGLQVDRGRIESYVDQGYTTDQLTTAFSEIGVARPTESAIANRFGQTFTQADSEAARIQGSSPALNKQRELFQSEKALFDQRAAADAKSMNKNQAGRY